MMSKTQPLAFLNDAIVERIIFAMEDQTKSHLVDLRTGELVDLGESPEESAAKDYLAPPPPWAPADGFRLMETYCARLKNLELKRALLKALSRGKGVFKAFRQELSAHPGEEALYRDYKIASLRPVIEAWLDDMRESIGLSRLGPEPEEYEELADEEFQILSSPLGDLGFDLGPLIEKAQTEATAWLPAAAAFLEQRETLDFLEHHKSEIAVRFVAGSEDWPIAAAAGAVEIWGGRPLGLLRFLYVDKEFRSLGLEFRLIESLGAWFKEKGVEQGVVRSLFLRPELDEELVSRGFRVLGSAFLFG